VSFLSREIALPDGFRAEDILAFHRRDPQMLSERVGAGLLEKGLLWDGHAACLTVAFHPGRALAELAVDGPVGEGAAVALDVLARRMLGLTQGIEAFERAYAAHPRLGPLIARNPGLRVPVAATPFEALTWAITGQQISVAAATSLRRKLVAAVGGRHSGGLLCYPDAGRIAGMAEADLRRAGFSQTKARTLIALGRGVRDGALPLEAWAAAVPVEDIRARLGAVAGIGPWTISYALLRGFGWLDGSLHGDVAVRRGLQVLLGAPERITEERARRWLADFSPWRALVAAHLWALKSAAAY
jgi:3-methyladenine DNA glycosylase/8-oxoguanine DNA glycosylase